MKFTARLGRPAPTSPGAGRPRADWLKEWLENRSQYVLMSCGHFEDLKYGHLLIIQVFGANKSRIVMCERCNVWVCVTRSATFHEYFKLPPAATTEEPLF